MIIGINATAAFIRPRTGVEEYTYQLIKGLAMLKGTEKHRFVLYNDPRNKHEEDFLSDNFEIKNLKWGLPGWTQIRLASQMAVKSPDVLFIPVHVLPLIHPQKSVVTLHGLEFEYYPNYYPKRHLKYLKWITRYALKNASKIIAISENTKKDLVELYGGNPEKIKVVYHGVNYPQSVKEVKPKKPYILFVSRIETRKNVQGLINAFNMLKKRYGVPHELIFIGSKGHDYEKIRWAENIVIKGYVSEQEKWSLLKGAEMMVMPSLYEGFSIPVLEAQSMGCPVITSNISSMPEVAGDGAILVEPRNIEEICDRMYQVIENREFRKRLINYGFKNVKKFSWQKCAEETLNVLTNI